jgi:serine/threonine-protein kinase
LARRLNVNTVLEGSIRRIRDRIRVTVQLVKATDGYHLWSEKYDCGIEDEFAIQDEIARKIAESLRLQLVSEAGVSRRHTSDHEAYHLYLKGRYHWNKMTAESYEKGLQYAQQAIAKDPGYALAYTGLADAYSVLALNGVLPPRQVFAESKTMAIRALELDESLPEAHISIGIVRFWYDWDWEGAEAAFRRGLQLNPNLTFGAGSYAWLLISLSRFDEAMAQIEYARNVAPLDVTLYAHMAYALLFAGRNAEALQEFRNALEIDADFAEGLNGLGLLHTVRREYAEARQALEKAVRLSPRSPRFLGLLGHVCAAMGDRERALEILQQLEQQATEAHVAPVPLAWIHLGLGDSEKALQCLSHGFEQRDGMMVALNISISALYQSIQQESRFIEILQAMKFPERR